MVSAGSITVAVRVRPPSTWEAARLPEPFYDVGIRGDGALSSPLKPVESHSGLREVVKIVDDRILMFDPDEKDRARAFAERGLLPPGTKRFKDKRFMFDRVFDADARQIDVFEATAKPLLDGFLDGYNATVFAYGATGCGKTHTISGTDTDPGLIYLTMADLFQKIEERQDEHIVEVGVTFLEIYNEEIRDLLAEPGSYIPRGGLQIREDKAVKVVGLVELHPKSAEQIKDIVLLGNTRRTQSPTHANETSSRSHAVLQIHVTQSPRTAATSEERSMATLSIIDLAGSERAAATTNMGQRMVEGANINKSLLALGNCINALCESGGATRHVPYRNSKLTRLLKFSLGGNCKTVMIVCVAPTSNHFDDTHNTLLYADRASKIKTKVVTRNVVNVDRHVGQYVEAINRLNLEVAELKGKLAGKLKTEVETQTRKLSEARSEVARAKEEMQRKIDQTRASVIDGACCQGRLILARMKLAAIHPRLLQLSELRNSSGNSSLASAIEESTLRALAAPEETLLMPRSLLQLRLQKSSDSRSMLDVLLQAIVERKSGRLDDFGEDNVRLHALLKRAELDQLMVEREKDIVTESLSTQAKLIVTIIRALAEATSTMEESSQLLRTSSQQNSGVPQSTLQEVSSSLSNVAISNRSFLSSLLDSSSSFVGIVEDRSSSAQCTSTAFENLNGTRSLIIQRDPSSRCHIRSASHRFSSISNHSTSPARKSYRTSPRKSLRSSMAHGVPRSARRVVSERMPEKKKTVQWKDEIGEGNLTNDSSSIHVESGSADSATHTLVPNALTRSVSRAGSESEWEDEKMEKGENVSSASSPLQASPTRRTAPKRPRASRLDTSFLKARGSHLGSLAESDETKGEACRPSPLSDCGNRLPAPIEGISSYLYVPKGRSRIDSPHRREPSSFRQPASTIKNSRRRSNVGSIRNEKSRRRSSLLPRLSPQLGESTKIGPRRLVNGPSPAKHLKRASLLVGTRAPAALRTSMLRVAVPPPSDPNGSSDISFKGYKPTWR